MANKPRKYRTEKFEQRRKYNKEEIDAEIKELDREVFRTGDKFFMIDETGNIIGAIKPENMSEYDKNRWNAMYRWTQGSRPFPLIWVHGEAEAVAECTRRKKETEG